MYFKEEIGFADILSIISLCVCVCVQVITKKVMGGEFNLNPMMPSNAVASSWVS
jgi:hypothetical protein